MSGAFSFTLKLFQKYSLPSGISEVNFNIAFHLAGMIPQSASLVSTLYVFLSTHRHLLQEQS